MIRNYVWALFACGLALFACGGKSIAEDPVPTSTTDGGVAADADIVTPDASDASSDASTLVDSGCANPAAVIVRSGENLGPPLTHTSLRLDMVYQGTSMGITGFEDSDSIVPASDAPLVVGTTTGFWAEVQSVGGADAGTVEFTRLFQDPTRVEAPANPDGGGFVNGTLPVCNAKPFSITIPGTNKQRYVVIYGPPYGTNQPSVELARFGLIPVID